MLPGQLIPDIYESSLRMAKKIANHSPKELPFEDLTPGYSFFVQCDNVNETSFRSLVSTMSTMHGRQYKCTKHKKERMLEVSVVGNGTKDEKLPIYESSPTAKMAVNVEPYKARKYFFEELPEGCSYTYLLSDCEPSKIRVAATLWSRKLNCKIVCIEHRELGILEVAKLHKHQLQQIPNFVEMSPRAEKHRWNRIEQFKETEPTINEIEFWNK